jgi:hypothetical protein
MSALTTGLASDDPQLAEPKLARKVWKGLRISDEEIDRALETSDAQYGPIITLKEAAGIARVAPTTLKRWVSEGRFSQSAKRGKPLLFWRDRFIAEVMR